MMKRMLILLGLVLILLAGCKETKSGQEYYERYESLMDSGKPLPMVKMTMSIFSRKAPCWRPCATLWKRALDALRP